MEIKTSKVLYLEMKRIKNGSENMRKLKIQKKGSQRKSFICIWLLQSLIPLNKALKIIFYETIQSAIGAQHELVLRI
jgi:hypothetical protein